jgi:hypothetical protein
MGKLSVGSQVKCIRGVSGFMSNCSNGKDYGIVTLLTSSLVYIESPITKAMAIVLREDEFDKHFVIIE